MEQTRSSARQRLAQNAMAVGASKDGIFLVGPQEGVWTPSSAVLEIQQGDYYGMGPNLLKRGGGEEAEKNNARHGLPSTGN